MDRGRQRGLLTAFWRAIGPDRHWVGLPGRLPALGVACLGAFIFGARGPQSRTATTSDFDCGIRSDFRLLQPRRTRDRVHNNAWTAVFVARRAFLVSAVAASSASCDRR